MEDKILGFQSEPVSAKPTRPSYNDGSDNHRSSHQRCSVKKAVLRNFVKFTGKRLCQILFFNKVAGLRPLAEHRPHLTEHIWATASGTSNPA